jgi:hypothetical protein
MNTMHTLILSPAAPLRMYFSINSLLASSSSPPLPPSYNIPSPHTATTTHSFILNTLIPLFGHLSATSWGNLYVSSLFYILVCNHLRVSFGLSIPLSLLPLLLFFSLYVVSGVILYICDDMQKLCPTKKLTYLQRLQRLNRLRFLMHKTI